METKINIQNEVTNLYNIKELYVLCPDKFNFPKILTNYKIYAEYESIKEAVHNISGEGNAKLLVPDCISENELTESGLEEFTDYIYERYINKKLVVVYGNCHTTVISQYLQACEEFNEDYAVYPIKPIHTISDISYFEEPIFRYCNVFIHQSIQKKNRYGEEYSSESIISKLPKACVTISIPNVYKLPTCFFPQYTKEQEFKSRSGASVFFRDSILDGLAAKGFFTRKAAKDYLQKKHFEEEKLSYSLEEFFCKVEMRERDWDIKCLDYIKNNYQQTQLFYDPNHPTNDFLFFVVEELLKYMGIKYNKRKLECAEVDVLSGYEMPILPEVKKYYGMTFQDHDELRVSSYNKVRLGKMDLKQYIRQYLACEWQNPKAGKIYQIIQHFMWYGMKIYNRLWKVVQKRKICCGKTDIR